MNEEQKKKIWMAISIILFILLFLCMSKCGKGFSLDSLKELFITYPETKDCMGICEGWDVGYASKIADDCLVGGDSLDGMLIIDSLYIYDKIYCCCYNVETLREPEIIEEEGFICCETFNYGKYGEKVDISYGLMTRDECSGMLDIYDGSQVVDSSFCEEK